MRHNHSELSSIILSAEFGSLRIVCESAPAAQCLRRALYHQMRREGRTDFTLKVANSTLFIEHHKRTMLEIFPETTAAC